MMRQITKNILCRFPASKVILLITLATLPNLVLSMSNPKSTLIQLDLSGNSMSFSEPVNYSKDFPSPLNSKYIINIYDKDAYTDSAKTKVIRKSYWDYGKGFIFGKVKGTLSMTIVLYHTNQESLDLTRSEDFLKALKSDFDNDNSKQDIEDFGIDIPKNYTLAKVNGLNWGQYEYFVNDSKRLTYALPLSDQHYIKVNFNFINNSRSEDTDWMNDAQKTISNIVSTFSLNK